MAVLSDENVRNHYGKPRESSQEDQIVAGERDIHGIQGDKEDIVKSESIEPGPIKSTDEGVLNSDPSGSAFNPSQPDRRRSSDAASVRSLPVVQITEPQSAISPASTPRLQTTHSHLSAEPSSFASGNQSGTNLSSAGSSLAPSERHQRHRSAIEFRSPNRFSGFLSNFILRRDSASLPPQTAMPNDTVSETDLLQETSRSGTPSSRPITPPPPLPPPTLQELGLDLSVITSDLAPSHFSAAPSSGAFLAPHYLLLCHPQGLDVLPIVSPPAPQPYALVRRVSFKAVVVMEQRGVLVAIAGRRDGVRVYALDEVKKAVEWRMEVEMRRERERTRRATVKKLSTTPPLVERRESLEKKAATRTLTPPPTRNKHARRLSYGGPSPSRTPSAKRPSTATSMSSISQQASAPPLPIPHPMPAPMPAPHPVYPLDSPDRPPPYSASGFSPIQTRLRSQSSTLTVSISPTRPESVVDVLAGRRNTEAQRDRSPDEKSDWAEGRDSSEDEAINVVAAGASGSQALDERTSMQHSASSVARRSALDSDAVIPISPQMSVNRRDRPENADTNEAFENQPVDEHSANPTPTFMTFREALAARQSPSPSRVGQAMLTDQEEDDFHEEGTSRVVETITLAQALMESRLPDLPPAGTRRPQQPILATASHPVAIGDDDPVDENMNGERAGVSLAQILMESRLPSLPPAGTRCPQEPVMIGVTQLNGGRSMVSAQSAAPQLNGNLDGGSGRSRERRRWTGLPSIFSSSSSHRAQNVPAPTTGPATAMASRSSLATTTATTRSASRLGAGIFRRSSTNGRSSDSRGSAPAQRGAVSHGEPRSTVQNFTEARPTPIESISSHQSNHSRFLPRIISNVLQARRSDEYPPIIINPFHDQESQYPKSQVPVVLQSPPPKLEYVKLPGTKGTLTIKAVETAKKSFLAILCGDNGEKVELFAGTWRTALGLSRTFILPDTPRSLELQLQGDDLVEVFLMFSQNVFGLEPATVRVREVRIGRAERRAARRRARGLRLEDGAAADNELNVPEDDINVNINVGLTVTSQGTPAAQALVPAISPEGPATLAQTSSVTNATSTTNSEDMMTVNIAQMGPYTTFQQLSFAPNFPLASIADEYIIPPTYPVCVQHSEQCEGSAPPPSGGSITSQMQFNPPGLPVPAPIPPSRWFYRDPKGVVHGPWKASLMQAWYKDGFLPLDLPLRRETDTEYILLKDLRLQSVDPTHPFKSPPPPAPVERQACEAPQNAQTSLLSPLSLLAQPKHFGPPALFFSSRGGHSTAVVDAKGRSVLKGRVLWSAEDEGAKYAPLGRMGDVKRLEPFDLNNRSVLVAMRQGGLEAVDLGDALLRPADESRIALPQFTTTLSEMSRRSPFVWRIGTPVSASPTSSTILSSRPKATTHLTLPYKRPNTSSKSPAKSLDPTSDTDPVYHDEILYLGRKEDEIYICERNAGAFRILRLSSNPS